MEVGVTTKEDNMKLLSKIGMALLAVGLVFGLTGCPNGNGDTAVTFISVTANGNDTTTTTQLTLIFSEPISGLQANDIMLGGEAAVGVTMGTFTGTPPVYTVQLSGVTQGGNLTITVTRPGYNISGNPRTVNIYHAAVEEGSGVDFTNHVGADRAITVDNQTGEYLVAFAGSLSMANLLGGIPPWSGEFGIRREPTIFNRTRAFPMILITEAQFIEYRNSLAALTPRPFSRVFVFYNHLVTDNPQVYAISGQVGGDHILRVTNNTGLDVELRLGGTAGPVIGFAPRGMPLTDIAMHSGDAIVFPVFRFFNEARNPPVLVSSFPSFPPMPGADRLAWRQAFNFPHGQSEMRTIDADLAFGQMPISLGSAWIVVDNQSSDGINLHVGGTPVRDTMNYVVFGPNQVRVVPIEMPGAGGPDTFVESRQLNNMLQVGMPGTPMALVRNEAGDSVFTLNTNMQYTVIVRGNLALGQPITGTIYMEPTAGSPPIELNIRDLMTE